VDILVTITILTYNSGEFIADTLESIKLQTYQNLDLIISDDASQDITLEVVHKWISKTENKKRFNSIEIVEVPYNTGVSANCNRGIKAARGEWVKFIAGDDILLPNCIEDNMKFVKENPESKVIFSQVMVYNNTFEDKNYVRCTPEKYPYNIMHKDLTAEDQYNLLILSDRVTYTPSYFFNKKTLLNVGGYDETNRLVEDYPMWLKLTQSGVKLYYFHKRTTGYRIHQDATNNASDDVLFKPSEINNYSIRRKYAHPHLPWITRARETWTYHVSIVFRSLGWTKNTVFLRRWYSLWTIYLNPFVYLQAINERLIKK